MTLDIAMGGSTNTVLHLLAAAHEGEIDFTMADIDRLSRRVPVLCKVAPVGRRRACRGRASRRRHHGHSRRTRPRRPAQPRRDDGACAVARARAVAQRHQAHRPATRRASSSPPRRAACRPRSPSARRRATTSSTRTAHKGVIRDARARLLEGRRPRRALRQPRARRLHREDGRRRRQHPQVRGPGEDLREPGRRRARHPQRRGRRRRRRRHPLRGPARRPGHAGDALSDQLSEIEGPRQSLRADHRRALLRRHLGPVDRPCLAGSGGGRRRSASSRTATASRIDIPDRTIQLLVSDEELAQRRAAMEAKGKDAWKPAKPRKRKVSTALRAYAAFATSAARGAVREVP